MKILTVSTIISKIPADFLLYFRKEIFGQKKITSLSIANPCLGSISKLFPLKATGETITPCNAEYILYKFHSTT